MLWAVIKLQEQALHLHSFNERGWNSQPVLENRELVHIENQCIPILIIDVFKMDSYVLEFSYAHYL
ncbi:MAG: hypothetical protein PF489_15120 [Salinivirgaceae bacterium]|nr:hypothetical protein [Salinivirgaceae bacterium]